MKALEEIILAILIFCDRISAQYKKAEIGLPDIGNVFKEKAVLVRAAYTRFWAFSHELPLEPIVECAG